MNLSMRSSHPLSRLRVTSIKQVLLTANLDFTSIWSRNFVSKAVETSGFLSRNSKFVFNLTLESLRGLIVYPAGWMFVALGLDMCGTNENAGMPIMEIPFTINSRRHRPHLPQNAAQASGLIQWPRPAFQPSVMSWEWLVIGNLSKMHRIQAKILYSYIFACGAAVMCLEMAHFRVMQLIFSTVWFGGHLGNNW